MVEIEIERKTLKVSRFQHIIYLCGAMVILATTLAGPAKVCMGVISFVRKNAVPQKIEHVIPQGIQESKLPHEPQRKAADVPSVSDLNKDPSLEFEPHDSTVSVSTDELARRMNLLLNQ